MCPVRLRQMTNSTDDSMAKSNQTLSLVYCVGQPEPQQLNRQLGQPKSQQLHPQLAPLLPLLNQQPGEDMAWTHGSGCVRRLIQLMILWLNPIKLSPWCTA